MLLIHFRISEVSKGIANEKLMDRNEEKFVNRRVFADSKSPWKDRKTECSEPYQELALVP